jgi:acyl-CoA synthetase (AMP-forming)/AMP-acid ligase II
MAELGGPSRQAVSSPNIGSLLSVRAADDGELTAFSLRDDELTYGQVDAAVDRVAVRLARLSPELAGRRVVVIGPNVPALAVGMFAAWREGAVAVPLSARLREYDLTSIITDAAPVAVISVAAYRNFSLVEFLQRFLERVTSVRGILILDDFGEINDEFAGDGDDSGGEPLGSEVGALLYTSGTTGKPKGALVQHAREAGAAEVLRDVLALTPDDRCAQVIPIAHAFGLSCLLTAFAAGARVVLGDSSITVRPLLDAVRQREATVLHGSPALFLSVLKATPEGLPSVQRGFVGGAGSPPGLLRRLDDVGMRILNLYGMTEIAAAACCRLDDPPDVRYATAGRPLPGFEWRVEPAPAAADVAGGELLVRGPWVTPGYFRRAAETSEAFIDGWFRTGDIGAFDENGNITITGRLKEVVNVAGFSVFPAELEGFLLTHPDIAQGAVVGAPDENIGEVLQAFVVPKPGTTLTPESVLQFARGRIADYKLPYRIRVVDELPLLASGKPDRVALKALAANG